MIHRVFALIAALVGVLALNAGASAADWRDQGPRSLVMTYRVAPADRIGFAAAVRASTLPRLEALRTAGELDSYHVLESRYVDAGSWDLMVILTFRRPPDLAHWRSVEAVAPAGLAPDALRLVSQIETAPGDMARSRAAPARPGDPAPVYLVVPYDYLVSTDDYLTYADGYLLPQVDGWIEDGALSSYGLFLPRYAAGRWWSSLLILAYRGDDGLARRDAVVAKVRARLAASPEWTKWAENKAKLRVEKEPMVADELSLPRPIP